MVCNFKPYEGNEKYIFVSYAHVDGKTVYPILERLNEAGYRIWYDEGIEWGTEWPESIAKHLRLCQVCLVFHSSASASSPNCRQEVNYALKKRRDILSVYLEDIELSDGLDMQLSSYQSTFWYQYKDKERFFDRLMNDTHILEPCGANGGLAKQENNEEDILENPEINDDRVKLNRQKKLTGLSLSAKLFRTRVKKNSEEQYSKCKDEDRLEKENEKSEQPVGEKLTNTSSERESLTCEGAGNNPDVSKVDNSQTKEFDEFDTEIKVKVDDSKNVTLEEKRNLSAGCENMGDICMSENNLIEARMYYGKKMRLDKEITNETKAVEDRRKLSVDYDKLGQIYKLENNLSEARKCYRKKLEIEKQIVDETGMVEDYRSLSMSYNKLGDIYKKEGNLSETVKCYENKLDIDEKIASETGAAEDRRSLSFCYHKIGKAYKLEDKLSEARRCYEMKLKIDKQLVDEEKTAEDRRNLSWSYEWLGDICKCENDLAEAKECYIRKIELDKQLLGETGLSEDRNNLSLGYKGLSEVFEAQGNQVRAQKWRERSIAVLKIGNE